MTKRKVWMVRAGKGGTYADEFIEQSFVGIGWTELGEIDAPTSKMELKRRVEAEYPNERPGTLDSWASQIKRYVSEIDIGDEVTTYDPDQRLYFLGTIRSRESLDRSHDLGRRRSVKWDRKVARDSLSVAARNSLGAISTLFRVPPEVASASSIFTNSRLPASTFSKLESFCDSAVPTRSSAVIARL
jgi:restriction system protein